MTAVEWLEEQLFELRNPTLNQIEIMKQAKEMEKQQIEDAYKKGRNSGQDNWGYGNDITSEQYYNETFKNN